MDTALRCTPRLPLADYCLFESQDVDEARDFVGRMFCPHELSTLHRGGRLEARHHSARLHRHTSLNYVQYGAAVRIEPGYLRDFFLLQIPLQGGATVRCGTQSVESRPMMASFPSPTEALSMRWHDSSPQLIVKLDREALQARLEALLQAPLHQPLVFELGVDLAAPGLSGVAGFIAHLRSVLDDDAAFLRHGVLAEQAENHLMSSVLLAMRHNHSAALAAASGARAARGAAVLPRSVKRAQEFMRAHAELAIGLADICMHVGVSARSLQQAFQQHTGAGPMAFLRELRLDSVHAELLAGTGAIDAAPKVIDVATRYGFMHLGHFAAHYRRRFAEAPSETRRRGGTGQ